jgi:hypothetical protein
MREKQASTGEEPFTIQIATIGLDLAKHVFQVHGVDEHGSVTEKRRLRRAPPGADRRIAHS